MKSVTRRGCLAMAGAASALAAAPAFAAEPSLNSLARAKGMMFGSAVGAGRADRPNFSGSDPRYWDILAAECGLIVPENELKWYALHPAPDVYAFGPGDALQAKAKALGLQMRGHNLLWNRPQYLTAWVNAYDFGPRPASAAEKLLVDHIKAVCAHYPDVRSWDVINETIDPDTGELRDTIFTKHLGPAVVDIAFHAAREAAPKAELVYNDYMSWEPGHEKHRAGVLRLLERMKANKTPLDALGVQSHLRPSGPEVAQLAKAQSPEWGRFLDQAAAMGVQLLLTEFDVADVKLPGEISVRDRAVADYARAYLDLTLSRPQVRQILAWGMLDPYSWLQNQAKRSDGLPERPTLYDGDYRPTPLRDALAAALAAAPAR